MRNACNIYNLLQYTEGEEKQEKERKKYDLKRPNTRKIRKHDLLKL